MIYFAQQTNGGPIRIGCSTNVTLRQSSLGSWVCGGVEIITTLEGDYYRERILLEIFKPLNVDRDWFRSDATMWRFLLECAIPNNLDWLPICKTEMRDRMKDRVIDLFGDMETAVDRLGYAKLFCLQTAINANNTSSYQLAAKVKFHEMLRDGVMPDFIHGLHVQTDREPAEVAA